ncbi:DUF4314 domain-containing protein [Desulfosporosinus sp. FKB]|uniref:DUF4314 domain-containing protein n=1 Tax=Desulfosporosinus sp. FKB TaxID=1969835 RepID=UPI000B4973A4|nr:DUF4314 domain-containing protein [Desulfosporosinus sp. FKB]
MLNERNKVERLKEMYPKGTHIRLTAMSGELDMPSGLTGTVDFVDDIGQLQMTWDNGRTLALVPGEDSFSAISQPKPVQTRTEKPDAPLIGSNGNIFNLMGIASRTLKVAGMREQANQMYQRITASDSYGEALNIIGEYVNFTEADQSEQSNDVDEQFGMRME